MPTDPQTISDRQFYALAHPLQRRRFYLAFFFAVLLFPVILVGIIAGTIVLIVPLLAFVFWVCKRIMFARFLGNCILVSEINYPRIKLIADELKSIINYPKRVWVFVYEQGSFNAYMLKFFWRDAIFLNSELLEAGVNDNEVRWIIGRFIGYLRARRQAGLVGRVIRAAQRLGVFNVFLLPYERALVYTGDRLALAAIDGDISDAISAMQKLLVGRQLGYSINPEGIVEQQREVKGSIFALLARLMSGYPHLTTRYVDLIAFAKVYFPARFTSFEAANPSLPTDLARLAAAPRAASTLPEETERAWRPSQPLGWLALGGVAAATVVFLVWVSSGAVTNSAGNPAGSPATAAPIVQQLPAHVHQDRSGSLAPDAGCKWLSDDPKDFRVTCR
jgi:hypothetical protein